MSLGAGRRLGHYEILSPLGAGGMGEVYRARDHRLKRDVAIKVLPQTLAPSRDALERFEREALAVAALSHPNILSIYDFGTEEGVSYSVMELLEGQTLRAALDGGPPSEAQVREWSTQIARGLAAAHEKGIVHRDLKPENLEALEKARQASAKALAIDPRDPRSHARLAEISLYESDLAAAARHVQRALELDPACSHCLSVAANLLGELGRTERCVEVYECLTARNPVAPIELVNLALSYLEAGSYDKAIPTFKMVLQLTPGRRSAQQGLIHAYRDAAFSWLEKWAARYGATSALATAPLLRNLHQDPRWLPLLRRFGYAPEQLAVVQFSLPPLPKEAAPAP